MYNFHKHNNVIKWFPLTQVHLLFPPLLWLHVLSCSPVVFFPQWYSTDSDTVTVHLAHSLPAPLSVAGQLDTAEHRWRLVSGMNQCSTWAALVEQRFTVCFSFGDKGFKPAIEKLWWCEQRSNSARADSDLFLSFSHRLKPQLSELIKHEENADDNPPDCTIRVSKDVIVYFIILLLFTHRRSKVCRHLYLIISSPRCSI